MKRIRNIGILAHVDAGKTTLSERLLTRAGAIRQPGSVDAGTAHTDKLALERRRGISVRATAAPLDWKGTRINLIDTPGHADFAFEVERSLWALDGAVLLISAADGVQPQAELLFHALRERSIPTLIFINKTDREGADVGAAIRQAKALLSPMVGLYRSDEQLQEALAERDERAMADFLSGAVYPRAKLLSEIRPLALAGQVFPAFDGSALKDEGVEPLLDAIVELLPAPSGKDEGPLCGVVFAVEPDDSMGRAACVRLYSGQLKNRDSVRIADQHPKITQIRALSLGPKGEDIGQLGAGELGVVYGLSDARVGQVLGDPSLLPHRVQAGELGAPLLMVKLTPHDSAQLPALRAALSLLSAEDPLLGVTALQGEPHIRVMGAIQLEVLQELVPQRFGIPVSFGPPRVIFRETIRKSAMGFYAYTMPKPCWAVLKFQIDPLPRGSGVVFESVVPAREILPRYQHQVEQAIPLAIKQGMLGWQVDDVRITLVAGEHHLVHTHPLDFIVCTPIAFLDGMRRGGSMLLEPYQELTITAPESHTGRLISEIAAMRGAILHTENRGSMVVLRAEAPVSSSLDFSVRLPQITSGRGALSVRLSGYRDCPMDPPAICPRAGVHPLDTSKYILASRSALDGAIFDP